MDKVYIISRYRADTEHEREFNRKVARHFCRQIILEGKQPVAPHLFYTQFLDDNKPAEHWLGIGIGLKDLREADEFLLVLIDGKISEGMRQEIIEVSRQGKRGRIVSMSKREIKAALKVSR